MVLPELLCEASTMLRIDAVENSFMYNLPVMICLALCLAVFFFYFGTRPTYDYIRFIHEIKPFARYPGRKKKLHLTNVGF